MNSLKEGKQLEALPTNRFKHVPMLAGNFSGLRRVLGEFTDLFVSSPVPYNFSEYLAFLGNQIKEVQLAEKMLPKLLRNLLRISCIREFCSRQAQGRFFLAPSLSPVILSIIPEQIKLECDATNKSGGLDTSSFHWIEINESQRMQRKLPQAGLHQGLASSDWLLSQVEESKETSGPPP